MIYGFEPYRLDTDRLELWCGTDAVALEPQVFRLLLHLIENQERVVSKDELIAQVWEGRIVSDATLSSRINAARRAVGDDGKKQAVIHTVSKRGFRFVADARIEPMDSGRPAAAPASAETVRTSLSIPSPPTSMASERSGQPADTVVLRAFKVAGGEETEFLADGLREDLLNSLSGHSAINVIRELPQSQGQADFALEGSVRGRGDRVRLTFSLIDVANNCQVWSERYDRQSDDVFQLEEEISRAVAAAVRVKLKVVQFERLRDAKDEELSVVDLLNKAAAYFARGPGDNDKIEASLRLALEREPDNSMTVAMLAFCLYRGFEFSPLAIPAESEEAITNLAERAVALKAESYFAHLVAGVVVQDLHGKFERALRHAQAALEANPQLLPAHAIVGIAECHLGELDAGIAILNRTLDVSREDPHRFRHQRELAIAHFIAGDLETATEMMERLVESEPQMDRNRLVQAALLWLRGDNDAAASAGRRLRDKYPGLSMLTKRPIWFGPAGAAVRFDEALAAIGF